MKRAFVIPDETRRTQATASDPENSAWVSANAGSGKTHVLSQRVIRLLLDGTEPSRILCLTYTRAAAANMANRVFQTLARWTMLPQAELSAAIVAIEGRLPGPDRMMRARRLFAEALETPGGLKIQTIHAFCEAILHQFPLEANVAGHFELLDAQMEGALVAEARSALIAGASVGGDGELADAFARIIDTGGESGLNALLGEIVRRRDALRAFLVELGAPDATAASLHAAFGVEPGQGTGDVLAAIWPDRYFDAALARAVASRAASAGKAKAGEFAEALAGACAERDPQACLDALSDAFLTASGTPRSTRPILAKGVAEHFPDLGEEFERMAAAVLAAGDRLALLSMLEATSAALVVADRLIARYERLKSARGFLDFNDLITRTVNLLTRRDAGAWVQYKLDKGIDHILLDEAQDTSPDQWRVVRSLAEEFFSGLGSREGQTRTIFAVGDEKQSIYSFQGAEPEAFSINGRDFATRVLSADGRFEHVVLRHSFRSTHDVLSAVDLVFARPEARAGLTRDDLAIAHSAIRSDEPGEVEIWPLISPVEVEQPDDWTASIDQTTAPAARLAARIAATIDLWLKSGEPIEGQRRRLAPGDVLVLVRKRDRFVHALSRELKNRHIPVAGADRLLLTDHIAVQDLMAIARVVLQPDDDLSLAALLKSPVFGLDEDRLFELAHGRGAASLLARMRRAVEADAAMASVVERLGRWRDEAGFLPPFEFFARILGRDGVRARMIARLGHEAGDIVDEFLSFCLAAGKTGQPGLEALIALLENGGPEIKREMDQARGEVRIMTAHAAKGLEAPVVFLVDSGSKPFSDAHLPTLVPVEAPVRAWQGKGFLWRIGATGGNSVMRGVADGIRESAEKEYRRLLYVSMTRAEDRLIVCGYQGKRPADPMTWHGLVRAGLEASPLTRERPHPVDGEAILRYRASPDRPIGLDPAPPTQTDASPDMPAALLERLPPAPALPRPLSPSRAGLVVEAPSTAGRVSASPVLGGSREPSHAILRGTLTHRLLQSLPALPQLAREAAARRYLDHAAAAWGEAERGHLWEEVRAILDDARFAPLFAEGSRSEITVLGKLRVGEADRVVSGKIDRLAVGEDDVLIVDYKTGRPVPETVEAAAGEHVAQLALYAALLAPVYPGRSIRAALLFTEGPRLLEIPDSAIRGALDRLHVARPHVT